MAPNSQKQGISARHRQVLKMLADKPRGCSVNTLLARGFALETLADLMRTGLATARLESMRKRGATTKVARVRITNAGRRALKGPAESE